MSRQSQKGRHCTRGLQWAVALMLAAPVAWPQAAQPSGDSSKPQQTQTISSTEAAPKRLNLYIGHAQELLSGTQWETILASQPINADESDDVAPEPAVVEVTGERAGPAVPDGIGGLFWALRHPTQAWRIFAPAKSQ